MKPLRIFYAADHTPYTVPSSRVWHHNLYLSLVDLGHDIVRFQYDLTPHFRNLDSANPWQKAFIVKNRPKLEQALLKQIEEAHRQKPIDLFFSYFYSGCARPETIQAIRGMGICTMNWNCNASYQFHLIEEIAPAYDYCLVPEKFRIEDYRSVGANPIYCQEAANPNIYKPYDVPVEYDVTFVGSNFGDRPLYIRYLYDQGIDVRVWGRNWRPDLRYLQADCLDPLRRGVRIACRLMTTDGWKVLTRRLWHKEVKIPLEIAGPPLSDEELIKMYSRSKISLGFSTIGEIYRTDKPIKQIRLRDFEAPMSGAFYMVEYMEELEEFFDIGKEIVCYYNKADLADKVKYYLSHDSEREKIRQTGYERVKKDHSWQKRLTDVFKQVGLV